MPLGVSPILADLLLSRSTVDRRAELRSHTEWLENPSTLGRAKYFVVHNATSVINTVGALVFFHFEQLAGYPLAFMGTDQGVDYFAAFVDEDFVAANSPDSWKNLRTVGPELSSTDSGLFVTATALANWHRTHPRCPRCGEKTTVSAAGWTRTCQADSSVHFPRTDPAVIMLITDHADRALLASQVRWQTGWMSVLAGFVESGESAEAAVVREAHEETGVFVDPLSVHYLGSQPWPFPNSLMLGYHARVTEHDNVDQLVPLNVDGEEIGEARWFSRAELADACLSGVLHLPPPVSIAHHLITAWFGRSLPVETMFK